MTKMSDKNHWLTASCDKIPQMQLCRAVMLKLLCDSSDLLNPAMKPHEEHTKYKSRLRWLNFKSKKTRNTKINPDLIPGCEAVELLCFLFLWWKLQSHMSSSECCNIFLWLAFFIPVNKTRATAFTTLKVVLYNLPPVGSLSCYSGLLDRRKLSNTYTFPKQHRFIAEKLKKHQVCFWNTKS